MNRLNPFFLFRGHWKSLSDYRGDRARPAWLLRFVVVGVPILVGALMLWRQGTLADPGSVLSALALLAGALLAAFAQVSTWRLGLTEVANSFPMSQRVDRDQLDDTAVQVLASSYAAAVAAFVLVLAMNFGVDKHGAVEGWWAAVAAATSVYTFILFLIALPRLYSAYVRINKVRAALNGYSSGEPDQDQISQ